MKNIDSDPSQRPGPVGEHGVVVFTASRLLLMSMSAARRGDGNTAGDLTDQVEEMGIASFEAGNEDLGYHLLEESLFFEEMNEMREQGLNTPENIAALYRMYGKEPPQA
jgi:hypothetical protein